MPRYDYECKNCGVVEIEHSMNERATVCPKCLTGDIKRIISGSSFILNGGGWYKDGYDKKGGN
jgi:putative FmdB family regulatory protein